MSFKGIKVFFTNLQCLLLSNLSNLFGPNMQLALLHVVFPSTVKYHIRWKLIYNLQRRPSIIHQLDKVNAIKSDQIKHERTVTIIIFNSAQKMTTEGSLEHLLGVKIPENDSRWACHKNVHLLNIYIHGQRCR